MLNNFGLKALSTFLHVPFVFETPQFEKSVETEYEGHIVPSARGVENDENVELVRAI